VNLIVKDPLQRRIEIFNWITLLIVFIPSLLFSPIKFSLGVLLGGFISILNFYWMARGLQVLFKNPAGNGKGPVMVKYYIRLVLTAVVLYFLIANQTVNVIGLVIGLSIVVINILVILMITLAKKNFTEEVT
jgi:hypothetical protein